MVVEHCKKKQPKQGNHNDEEWSIIYEAPTVCQGCYRDYFVSPSNSPEKEVLCTVTCIKGGFDGQDASPGPQGSDQAGGQESKANTSDSEVGKLQEERNLLDLGRSWEA